MHAIHMVALTLNPIKAISDVFTAFIDKGRDDIATVLNRFLFSTIDTSRPGALPFTSNPAMVRLNGGLVAAADLLLAVVFVVAGLRHIFEHKSRYSLYGLKAVLPKALLAIVLMHSSLMLIQLSIDFNNVMSHVAMSIGGTPSPDAMPWSASLSAATSHHIGLEEDVFHGVFVVGVVIALVILILAYVIRSALLTVLSVVAPLAALCVILPETREYARTWLHLFTTTLFMQLVQMLVLKVAVSVAIDSSGGFVSTIYALASLWIMLKVPGALDTAGHLTTKAKTLSHGVERAVHKAIIPHHTAHRKAA